MDPADMHGPAHKRHHSNSFEVHTPTKKKIESNRTDEEFPTKKPAPNEEVITQTPHSAPKKHLPPIVSETPTEQAAQVSSSMRGFETSLPRPA